jgi:hypothetical protein
MSSKNFQPLYTNSPWIPPDPYSRDQQNAGYDTYPYLVTPQILQPNQPSSLPILADNSTYLTPLHPSSDQFSPITPIFLPPAPCPVDHTTPDVNQYHPQYPEPSTTITNTQSPYSSSTTSQQILTPQYPFFPSNIFAYPHPLPQPRHEHDLYQSQAELPINYPNPDTQQNATADLYTYPDNTSFAYETQIQTRTTSCQDASHGSFGMGVVVPSTSHQHDMFQHEHDVGFASLAADGARYKASNRMDVSCHPSFHPCSSRHINHQHINGGASPIEKNHVNIFRSSPPAILMPTIDPKLSSWGNMISGGSADKLSVDVDVNDYQDHDRVNIPHPTNQGDANTNGRNADPTTSITDVTSKPTLERSKWVSSTKKATTPLRKRRPPQLHLPPPSKHMRIPIPTSIHSAPAASFSLDILGPSRSGDASGIVPPEPPKVEGWVDPEERPVPPVGYTVPGYESVAKIFDYNSQGVQPGVGAPSSNEVISTPITKDDIPPALAPTWQPYEPKAIPRATSVPHLRFPTVPDTSPPHRYVLVPGLNGFEVVPWRSSPRYTPIAPHLPQPQIPPTTAAPWEVSAAPAESVPPSTSSSWDSVSFVEGQFPIPIPVPIPVSVPPLPATPLIEMEPTFRERAEQPRTPSPPSPSVKHPWAKCEICGVCLSRQSDLQVSYYVHRSKSSRANISATYEET